MPFFTHEETEQRKKRLVQRIFQLQQAVENKKISIGDLERIKDMSSDELSESDARLLFDILYNPEDINIEAPDVIEALKFFDAEHADYLALEPLAVDNQDSFKQSLPDFALFYDIFIQYITTKTIKGELENSYILEIDKLAARTHWLKWKNTRPSRLNFDASHVGYTGLFEKFIAGKLKKDEWLTDMDIQRELKILEIEGYVHPFKADDIGLLLHFEREKHQHDDPKKPYYVPIVTNLGEDEHSRMDSRGFHWTRMLVKVDPSERPVTVEVKYTDELPLTLQAQKKIEETIRKALSYREQIGDYKDKNAQNFKLYQAFPDVVEPKIIIEGSGEQRDGYSCGYRAIRGVVSDLIEAQAIVTNDNLQKLVECTESASLRDIIYESLLKNQTIRNDVAGTYSFNWEDVGDGFSKLAPAMVEGQLFQLSAPESAKGASRTRKLSQEELSELAKLKKVYDKVRELKEIKKLAENVEESLTVNLQELLKIANEENNSLVLDVIFQSIAQSKSLRHLRLSGLEGLDKNMLYKKLDSLQFELQISSEDNSINDYLKILNARNEILKNLCCTPPLNAFQSPWDVLFQKLLFSPDAYIDSQTFAFTQISIDAAYQECMQTMGVYGFIKFLAFMAEHEEYIEKNKFSNQCLALTLKGGGLKLLEAYRDHKNSGAPFFPFGQLSVYIDEIDDVQKLINVIEEIIESETPLEKLDINLSLAVVGCITEDVINKLIKIITDKKSTTIITFSKNIEKKLHLDLLKKLENTALSNQRQSIQSKTQPVVNDSKPNEVILGKIGKAIFNVDGIRDLNTDIQIQEQQQQQQQQQVQTSLEDDTMPEEDELKEEVFTIYSGTEELVTREDIDEKLGIFIQTRPMIVPYNSEKCWDILTGLHASQFKYGIKKMTMQAAKTLIDHVQELPYGLHPDNLPKGFYLQKDEEENVILAYSPFTAPINPNESPLTIELLHPLPAKQWSGNMLQWMTKKQAGKLYKNIELNRKPKPTLEDCINNFFYLKDSRNSLNDKEQQKILKFIICSTPDNDKMIKQLHALFGKNYSGKNVKALSEVFYQQGHQGLAKLLDALEQLKECKGEDFLRVSKPVLLIPLLILMT